MKKTKLTKLVLGMLALMSVTPVQAQRYVDRLDRGLIAMKASTGNYLSWRILGEEYYDVQYNVYRDGQLLNTEPLNVSCYTDRTGTTTSSYTIKPVVRGVEKEASKAVTPWSSSYKEIQLKHEGIASTLVPNDACCADVDGDGEVEILMKFDNQDEMVQSYPKEGPTINGKATREYSIFEILKQDGTRLWWVNCGPNMGDFQNNEQNIVGYDWDMDGKSEVVMRLLEGSSIHMADGTVYTIGANGQNGTSWTNYRAATGGGTNWFMHAGKEFLVYCNGETGEIYHILDFPLARLEPGETDLDKAWGDGYGHRSNKFFFGAPYLDGRKPSIFLARGIYTRHKMAAYDVNPDTHKLSLRWKWYNNTNGPWKGQGYHNYAIADVDWDGRDEIVFGSMVIDDNGKGLSTTGFGHGDAQHCGDLNPYVHGQEQFCCNEDDEGFNYRDATTSKVYAATLHVGKDVGRAMAGNFTESFPGGLGTAWGDPISTVTNTPVEGLIATGVNSNFRIYWDGDLVSETFNYQNGKNTAGVVAKYGSWNPIYVCEGSLTNNDTKGTPCYQGDILGDWREEIIMRTANNNIRIYSTPTATTYRIPSLWADHQYRNAMVWQMCGYNQPPHPSFFLGKTDGITVAPPPFTMTDRTEVANGGTIDASLNGKDVIVCETNNTNVALTAGTQPNQLVFNVPTWVQGSGASECTAKEPKITYTTYTCTVTGGGMAGEGRLIKQGDGVLTLPAADFTHTGNTDIWAGVLNFDGKMQSSDLWLNRFAELNSNGGEFKSIKTSYASIIRPGGEGQKGNMKVGALELGFGSRIVVDLFAEDGTADQIDLGTLKIEAKTSDVWVKAGPTYLSPIIEVVGHYATGESKMRAGKYVIATISGEITGKLENIVLEGLATTKKQLYVEDGKLILEVIDMRDAGDIRWTGAQSGNWDLGESENFSITSGSDTEATTFVSGDNVLFDDEAALKTINVVGSVIPGKFTVNNTVVYTFQGNGGIDGTAKLVKEGTGKLTMKGENLYTGGNELNGGVTVVSKLSNQYSETGNLGGVSGSGKFVMQNGAELNTTGNVEMGSPITVKSEEGAVLNNSGDFVMDAAFSGTKLTKKGNGWLKSGVGSSLSTLVVSAGVVDASQKLASKIVAEGKADLRGTAFLSTPIEVADKATANLTTVNRATTNLALTGTGQLTVWCATEKGSNYYATRTPIIFNMSNFEGTLVPQAVYAADGRFTFDTSNGGTKWTLDIPADRFVQNTGKTLRIGQLTGTGKLGGFCSFSNNGGSGTNTWEIGNDKDFTFEGVCTSGDKFVKKGTGKMTVKGFWDCTGAVQVAEGELCLNTSNTTNAMLGTGALTVSRGAVLSGKGVLNNTVTVSSGATLRSGVTETNALGNLRFSGKNVTVSGTMQLYASSKSLYSRFSDIGTCKLNGTLKVILKGGIELAEGTEFKIIDANTITLGSNLVLDLDNQYEWDTTRLATEGILVVGLPTGIQTVAIDELGDAADIYTLSGVKISGRPTQRGIYIINGVKTAVK